MATKTVELREPFWGAGKKYRWGRDNLDLVGFGVRLDYLFGEGIIVIKTRWGNYRVDKELAKVACKGYRAYYVTKGVILAVIPRHICEKI